LPYSGEVRSFRGRDEEIFGQMLEQKTALFEGFEKRHRVLIKINLNTALPYPASTDPLMLDAVLTMLTSLGITNIAVGDCSSNDVLPTRGVFGRAGMLPVLQNRAEIVCFDEKEWVSVPIQGIHWDHVSVPKILYEVDRIVYLANVKTHMHADFSMGLKLGVGFLHPALRYDLHREFLQEKVVEIGLAVKPDLIFLDAREPFITGGPNQGDTARANSVLAGRDLLSVDLRGYELLYRLKEENNCLDGFHKNPFEMRQFAHAANVLYGNQTP
jgi:uncharacterized protein (DUF362 family)